MFYTSSKRLRSVINKSLRMLGLPELVFSKIPADNNILFFKRDRSDFNFLSNFYLSEFCMDGYVWPSVEHYYQAQKSFDSDYRDAVREARWPGVAKKLGDSRFGSKWISKRSLFLRNSDLLRPDWDEVKKIAMEKAVRAKYESNKILMRRLLATGTATIIEDSPFDEYWGIGKNGNGKNNLGKILMATRDNKLER